MKNKKKTYFCGLIEYKIKYNNIMENNKLFSEFPPVSTEKWEEVINKDLKGADYDKKLVYNILY